MYQQIIKDLRERGFDEEGLIGEGAFGKVYRVRERVTKKIYACKFGVEDGREHVEREAAFLKKVRHPLFAKYVEYWEGEGYACLIMEYVAGTNLEDFVRRRNKISEMQALKIAMELAEGLLYLHKLSIVFRDVKAQNIMIRQDGRVKLLDFGCACHREECRGAKVGTPGFAPLEQIAQGNADVYSDVYSLGRVIQYMLSGVDPCKLSEMQFEEIWKKHKCRKNIKNMVNWCVKKDAKERLPNMYVLLRSLKQLCLKREVFFRSNFILEKNIWKSNYKI